MSLAVNRTCLVVSLFAGLLAVGGCSEDDNEPPWLPELQAAGDEDSSVDLHVLDSATDAEGDALVVSGAAAEGHRVEVVEGGIVRLTPAPDFHGTVEVAYEVSDGHHPAVTGTATVTVRPINDPPIATGGTRTVRGAATVDLEAHDVDGDALTWEIVTAPAHGTITGDAPHLQYTPLAGFAGDDAIQFRVFDGSARSEPATVQLQIAVGEAPVASSTTIVSNEDRVIFVILGAHDPDGDTLSFTVTTQPGHGTLSGTPPIMSYTPARDFFGQDELQFVASDGVLTSNVGTVTIQLQPVNDAPDATPQSVTAVEDTAVAVTLEGSDVEGDPVTFHLVTSPAHGTVSAVAGQQVTYTPAANYHGSDSFSFAASDGTQGAAAAVTIDVAPVDDAPVAAPVSRATAEDTAVAVALVGSDVDGDPISYAIASPPAHGVLSGTAPNLTYTPALNHNGSDSFTYTVSDGTQASAAATVTLQVTAVNDPPVASDGAADTAEDAPVSVVLQASDVDAPAQLQFVIDTAPGDGTFSLVGSTLSYTPALNANGTRVFKFHASDGVASSNPGTVTIAIAPVNDPPGARDDYVATDPGVPLTFDVVGDDVDVEGDVVTLDSVDAPAHGTVEMVDGKIAYTPDAGFTGIEVFAYGVIDAHGAAATAQAHVGVGTFPPGAPTATIAQVSVDPGDRTNAASISNDGRWIALVSSSALVSDDTNAASDVYVYDRGTRTIARVSLASDGAQGNSSSVHPHISGDGRYVVFDSSATNLVPGDSNAAMDVFRHDRVTGATVRVSVASGGSQATGISSEAAISDDGNSIAFRSTAFDLVASDTNGAADVFVRDVAAGTTTRISVGVTGGDADLGSSEAAISGNGRYVSFSSLATNLVANDTNGLRDIFVRDRVAGTTTRVSVSSTGEQANDESVASSLSRDGRFVSFLSSANNLVPESPSSVLLYARDTQSSITTRPPAAGAFTVVWAKLSGDGRYASGLGNNGAMIVDRFAPAAVVLQPSKWNWPVVSGNGRYVVVTDTRVGVRITVAPNPL